MHAVPSDTRYGNVTINAIKSIDNGSTHVGDGCRQTLCI